MPQTGTAGTRQQPFLVYLNLNQGIRISYPAGWLKREQTAPDGFMVMFNSPPEDPADQFSENLNILAGPLAAGMNLEQFVQGSLAGMQQAPIQFLENTPAELAGHQAYRIVYAGPLPAPVPLSAKWLQYLVVSSGRGYVVTYTAEARKYDRFLPLIQEMFDSLEIK